MQSCQQLWSCAKVSSLCHSFSKARGFVQDSTTSMFPHSTAAVKVSLHLQSQALEAHAASQPILEHMATGLIMSLGTTLSGHMSCCVMSKLTSPNSRNMRMSWSSLMTRRLARFRWKVMTRGTGLPASGAGRSAPTHNVAIAFQHML